MNFYQITTANQNGEIELVAHKVPGQRNAIAYKTEAAARRTAGDFSVIGFESDEAAREYVRAYNNKCAA